MAAVSVAAAAGRASSAAGTAPTLSELVGQRLVVGMSGTTPSRALLGRIGRGEVGGVILFGSNVTGPSQLRGLTGALHEAARAAGRPRLLVVVDQEGADVRRLPWAPPGANARLLGKGTIPSVRDVGRATARALRVNGVDVDLAPVADVPRVPGAFIAVQGRAFSSDPVRVATRAAAFARGLAEGGVLATAKHFPGLGGADRSTDDAQVAVTGGPAALAADLLPFRALVDGGVPLVMLSSAVVLPYGREPALWTPAVHRLLRRDLGFGGATISDALEPVARTRSRSLESVAFLAARAGTDMLLFAGSEASTQRVHAALVAAARDGRLGRGNLERSYRRVLALKGTG